MKHIWCWCLWRIKIPVYTFSWYIPLQAKFSTSPGAWQLTCSYLARLHFHACCRVSMFLSGVLYLHWWKWHLEKQMSVVKDSHGSQEARRQIGAQHWISREKHLRHRLKKGLSVWQRVVLVRSEMNSILGAHLHWGTDCEDQLRPPSTSARHCL